MEAALRAERELEDIQRRMKGCMQQLADFMRRVKVERVDYRTSGRATDVMSVPKARRILVTVAEHFNMTVSRLTSRDKQSQIVAARQVAQYVMRQTTSLSFPEIAELTGLRDHTTVMHSIRRVEAMRKANSEFDTKLREIISQSVGDDQCPRCEMARHTGKCEGSSEDPTLRADQELERVRELA